MLRISQIKLSIDDDITKIKSLILKKLRLKDADLLDYRIYKESIDARHKGQINFIYTVDVAVKDEEFFLKKKISNLALAPDLTYKEPVMGENKMTTRPVVIGFGPAGMFSALLLAQMGYRPIVLERGQKVEDRVASINEFWTEGKLNPRSNVQFGEGGAGTFSDGKLTSRVRDLRGRKVLEEFVAAGAPEDILYHAHPHVGTDLLRGIVRNIREKIIELGGEVYFDTQVRDFVIENGQLQELVLENGEKIVTKQAVLAIGHSARDTFSALYEKGVKITAKPFAVGVRIEHPQEVINKAQYKEFAGHKRLGAAEYRLTYKASNGRGVYTFCMCPGGVVVPAASETGRLVTNGMSEHARDAQNANSGLLVQVFPEDFPSEHPLAGVEFQRKLEEKAFELGGATYQAPAQLVGDFLAGRASSELASVKPSYALGVVPTDLRKLFPDYISSAMQEALIGFDHKLHGFAMADAVMTGVESRSSSPVRINRDEENFQSLTVAGLYPSGEGAGFAGGIVSAAIDGLKCAEALISEFARPELED
ncbi:FAD-dependent protein [Lactococcus nasutitermitis]|uniref:FAD-dependent protein n=1 Tax=Lactococcus nasutitermitis TaxID=1652957 RepID=A0ABV9JE01_9LACT|nr:NAD(P)/FAD-dependent oxidoreductase [Lactococcus nasutitermitis]